MAISRSDFNKGRFHKRAHARSEHPVTKFLESHPKQAFRVSEIVAATKVNENTVRGMLKVLMKDQRIVHKVPYWAIRLK